MEGTMSANLELEARIKRIESTLVAIAKRVHLTGLGILNNNARQFNSQARDPQDQLQGLQIAEADSTQNICYRCPDDFPRTLIDAISLRWDAKRLSQLLGFYNVKIFRPGSHAYTPSENPEEGEEEFHKYIDVDDESQVGRYSKECFTYFISYVGLKRKVVENYLPSTERRQTE
ncbi:hypothetical protein TWF718_002774 [Orbilia javanica]|uniref:Uncharacterized protein n=1 Tax=Orbilia javanica TaxID=47235 RepID=A0AAN8RJ43_9PEZI